MADQRLESRQKSENDPDKKAADPGNLPTAKELTADEQMALFEKELKEEDWGHQPC